MQIHDQYDAGQLKRLKQSFVTISRSCDRMMPTLIQHVGELILSERRQSSRIWQLQRQLAPSLWEQGRVRRLRIRLSILTGLVAML